MALTKEQEDKLKRQGTMVGATPSTFDLGGGTVPAFPRNYGSPSGFSSINPSERTNYIPMGSVGTTSVGLSGTQTSFPYSQGMLAAGPTQFTSRLPQTPVAPSNLFAAPSAESARIQSGPMLTRTFSNPFLPVPERYSPVLTQGLTPVAQQTSMPIEGGPMSFSGSSAMTAPRTAEQQGRQAIQTPRGTIYATAGQAAAFEARPTAYEGRTPEQQQALLAQIRSQGPQMAQNRIAQQEEYFKQKRAESKALADATTEAFKSGVSPEKIAQARSSYYQSQPNTLAGIRSEFQSMVPEFGAPMEQRTRVAGVRSSFGLPAGGPQPMRGSYMPSSLANNDDRFRNPFSYNFGLGV